MSSFSGPDSAAPSWPTSCATSSASSTRSRSSTTAAASPSCRRTPGWRSAGATARRIEVDLAPVLRAARHRAASRRARKRLHPAENRIELNDGTSLDYDYLVIATGPELAFDEIEGLGPEAQHPVGLPGRPRAEGQGRRRRAGREPGPGDHRRGAGRVLLRPGLRIRLHPRQGAARRQGARPGADDLRHLRALYRPSRPRRRRRHQGPARERDAPAPHQVDHQRQRRQGRARASMLVDEIAEDGSVDTRPRAAARSSR